MPLQQEMIRQHVQGPPPTLPPLVISVHVNQSDQELCNNCAELIKTQPLLTILNDSGGIQAEGEIAFLCYSGN